MTMQVYQHWDPLKVCIVGSCWPPEFFSYIKDVKTRSIIEQVSIETQQDLDGLATWLQARGVKVLRPDTSNWHHQGDQYPIPPVAVRDHHIMIGDKFYYNSIHNRWQYANDDEWPGWQDFYNDIKDPSWPQCRESEFGELPQHIQQECLDHGYLEFRNKEWHRLAKELGDPCGTMTHIYSWIQQQGNQVIDDSQYATGETKFAHHHGSMITRVGKDLFFGTEDRGTIVTKEFTDRISRMSGTTFRAHIVDTGGHSDGTFCPAAPGLIVTYHDETNYKDSFPGWEVVYGSNKSSLEGLDNFTTLRNKGVSRWWIPGQEDNAALKDFIDAYFSKWTGNAAETRFFVNILMVDNKTAVVAQYDKNIFDAMERYGITCHVLPMRHLFFWDAGIHCVTSDLDRAGHMQDFFS